MIGWTIAAVAGKAVVYATCLVAGGGLIFLAIFASQMDAAERRYVVRLVRFSAAAAALATVVRVAILSGMLGGELSGMTDLSLIRVVLESSEGSAVVARLAGSLILATVAFGTNGATQAILLSAAIATVGSFALTGHTTSVELAALPRLAVAAHLAAVAYWIGALMPLLKVSASADAARVGAILKRFGDLAVLAVAVLIAAGLLLLWLLAGSLDGIVTSTYGRLVLVKAGLVAALLALGGVNKLRLTPGVAARVPSATVNLRRSISAEMVLAALILALTATFTTTTGPPVLE